MPTIVMRRSPLEIIFAVGVFVLFSIVVYTSAQRHRAKALDTLMIFGDSFSDNGISETDHYGFGRASSGYVWNEYVARDLGLSLANYAFSGAMSNFDNRHFSGWSGSLWQVKQFLEHSNGIVEDRDMIGYQITGANDILKAGFVDPSEIVQNNMKGIKLLLDAGTKKMFVVNMGNATVAPLFKKPEMLPMVETVEAAILEINKLVREEIVKLNLPPTTSVLYIDLFQVSNEVAKKFIPKIYDIRDPGLRLEDQERFGFISNLHLSDPIHRYVAAEVTKLLRLHFA